MRTTTASLAILLALMTAPFAAGQLRLHPLFDNHMVWPRDRAVPVWGLAQPGQGVTVSFREQKVETKAGPKGWFRAQLAAEPAGKPAGLFVSAGSTTLEFTDILVGDVWLCSGQSNMVWPVRSSKNGKTDIAAADNTELRMFKVKTQTAQLPLRCPTSGTWSTSQPGFVSNFSAVAYHFGQRLQQELEVPVGLVQSAVGGTPVEAWMSPKALSADYCKVVHERWRRLAAARARFQKQLEGWQEAGGAKSGKPRPRGPRGANPTHQPGALYCGMIAPLADFPFRGVIWYQGESNCGRPREYRRLFSSQILDWRQRLGQPDLPFLFVQIAPFYYGGRPRTALAELWESQMAALELPHTGMATTMDVGNLKDIHPRDKATVGLRLAHHALAVAYGRTHIPQTPQIREVKFESGVATVAVEHAGSGLTVRGDSVTEFQLAGADRAFHPATVKLVGKNMLVVSSPDVKSPVALRHAFRDRAQVTLFSSLNLPLLPYRTDAWPLAKK